MDIYYTHKEKRKAIRVTGREVMRRWNTLPNSLDNLLKDDGEAVSLTQCPAAFYPRKIPSTHFC
jgi:hypothetical protein